MSASDTIVFFHAPQTRSGGTRILLEELGASYELRAVNMKAGEQRKPAFLAVNPMGKVPAILHRGELVTEQVAILRALWTEQTVNFAGEYEHVEGVGIAPLPVQRPIPIWFGANAPSALARARARRGRRRW